MGQKFKKLDGSWSQSCNTVTELCELQCVFMETNSGLDLLHDSQTLLIFPWQSAHLDPHRQPQTTFHRLLRWCSEDIFEEPLTQLVLVFSLPYLRDWYAASGVVQEIRQKCVTAIDHQ